MDARRFVPALLVLMLPIEAHADRHKIGGRLAAVNPRRSSEWGWGFSLDLPLALKRPKACLCKEGEPHQHIPAYHQKQGQRLTISAVFEFDQVDVKNNGEKGVEKTYLAGLRPAFSFRKRDKSTMFEISGQALYGFSHSSVGEPRDLPISTYGLGVSVPVLRRTLETSLSAHLDRVVVHAGTSKSYWRPSFGIVVRLESNPPLERCCPPKKGEVQSP